MYEKLPLIHVSGSHMEIGCQIGESMRPQNQHGVENAKNVTSDALHLTKCTSFSVNQSMTANGNVLIAHNEDWTPEEESDNFLVHAKPDDGEMYNKNVLNSEKTIMSMVLSTIACCLGITL